MLLYLLAYVGGVLTIVSPCILPVLPFVFARAGQPFLRSTLPMLLGMAATFAAVASLAAVGGAWALHANQYGRVIALVILAFFGLILLFPSLADHVTRPLVSLGARLSESAGHDGADTRPSILASLLLGVATGLLWAPCAGPILGLILTGAALHGANTGTTFLLLAYALGAATSLALALLVGGRLYQLMKRSLGVGQWVRRVVGVAVLAAVAAIGLGVDTGFLTQASLASTDTLEQGLVNTITPSPASSNAGTGNNHASDTDAQAMQAGASAAQDLPDEGPMPALDGATQWLNSPPLTAQALKGKVVLIDFWTYSCINCLRAIPYVEAWAKKYGKDGLVVIGVHAPEFAFERNVDNVKKAIASLGITYPVAIDNNYAIWRAFHNEYWPAHYFIDATGEIRHHHFGEGDYAGSERVIQQLLAQAGKTQIPTGIVSVDGAGAEAAADVSDMQSPETYLGWMRATNFADPAGTVSDHPHDYHVTPTKLNDWGLTGNWTVHDQYASLNAAGGSIAFRFHARDLHLVLGPSPDGKPVRFKVTLDGKPPGENHGADIAADGSGTVTRQQLYQLIRQHGTITDHTFEIRFLDPGVQAYSFTFG